MPAKVNIDYFFRNDEQIGCNDTRRVQWQQIDTGGCTVNYTIEFRNKTNDIIGTVEKITGNFYCTSDFDNATMVIMWATYEGRQGIESDGKNLTATPEPSTTTTTASTTTKQKGIKLYLFLHKSVIKCYCSLTYYS